MSLKMNLLVGALLFLGNYLEGCVGVPLVMQKLNQVRKDTDATLSLTGQDPDEDSSSNAPEETVEEDGGDDDEDDEETPEGEQAVQSSALHLEATQKKNSCWKRDNTLVDEADAENYRTVESIQRWESCRTECDKDYRCEAYTWKGRTSWVAYTGHEFRCYLYKKRAESDDHGPIRFVSANHGITAYAHSRCQACGARAMEVKYRGKNLATYNNVPTWEQCQDKCEENSKCLSFTYGDNKWYRTSFKKCRLKSTLRPRPADNFRFSSGVPCPPGGTLR